MHAQLLSHFWLFTTPWTVSRQAPLSIGFSRQEYWSGLPFLSPGYLPDPGIEPESLASSALAGRFFTTAPPGKPQYIHRHMYGNVHHPVVSTWVKLETFSTSISVEWGRWTICGTPTLENRVCKKAISSPFLTYYLDSWTEEIMLLTAQGQVPGRWHNCWCIRLRYPHSCHMETWLEFQSAGKVPFLEINLKKIGK